MTKDQFIKIRDDLYRENDRLLSQVFTKPFEFNNGRVKFYNMDLGYSPDFHLGEKVVKELLAERIENEYRIK